MREHLPAAEDLIDVEAFAVGERQQVSRQTLNQVIQARAEEVVELIYNEIRRSGFVRMRVDGRSYNVEEPPDIDHRRKHKVEVVVDGAR